MHALTRPLFSLLLLPVATHAATLALGAGKDYSLYQDTLGSLGFCSRVAGSARSPDADFS